MELPLKADVYCTDGAYGKLLSLLSRDDAPVITHVIVVGGGLPEQRRLVPLAHVAGAEPGKVQLDVSRDQMLSMTTETQTVDIHEAVSEPVLDPTMLRDYEHVDEPHITHATQELIPPGTVTVDDKTDVSARGGVVGKLSAVVIHDDTGAIDSVVVHESLLHGGKKVQFPASVIDHINGPTILLLLSKEQAAA